MNAYVNDFNSTVKTYYKELKHLPPLSRERERDLLKEARNNNLNAKNEILKANLRFVFDVAKKYKGYGVPMCDLISEGNIGLTKAISRFDERNDVKFITYAIWWIRQSISECVRKRQIIDSVEVEDEIGNKKIYESGLVDIEDEEIKGSDVYCSNEYEENEKEIQETRTKLLEKLLSTLTDKEREIILMYYGIGDYEEMTLEDIGKKFNLSNERIRYIKYKILRKLRSEAMEINIETKLSL